MATRQYTLVVDQGADYTLTIPVLNDSGGAVSVAGWQVAGQIRSQAAASTVLAELDVEPDGTSVVLRIPRAVSSAWTFRTARYDVELTSPDGLNRTRLLEGLVVLRPEITA